MLVRNPCPAIALSTLLAAAAFGQDTASPTDGMVLYGVNRERGDLIRHDFGSGATTTVGIVTAGQRSLVGIDAAAYVPGFQNLYAFWLDPTSNKSKLVYVDLETAEGTVTHELEGGKIAGATAVKDPTTGQWTVYGAQLAELPKSFTVAGNLNINPNNSPQNEFTLTKGNGATITRDHLHSSTSTNARGEFYVGEATYIRVKPKGNGSQNGLIIDGKPFNLQNSNTYILTGNMQVRVYNDHLKNGKAMGHWWLEITGGTAHWVEDVDKTHPNRLVKVNHQDGVVTELMVLSRGYDSLASSDGLTFLATHDNRLYRLDPLAGTETVLGSLAYNDVPGLEMCKTALTGFESLGDHLYRLSPTDGRTQSSPMGVGARDLGTIVYVEKSEDPAVLPNAYD